MSKTIAVLPVAATEQHGPHLPLSVDRMLVDGVIAAALPHLPDDLPVLILPNQAVGLSPEHAAFAGTLTLKAETVLRVWAELADCVAATGIRKLVVLNSHGGQVGLADALTCDVRVRHGMLAYRVNWYDLPLNGPDAVHSTDASALFDAHEWRFGIHAGDLETSVMLALDPNLVQMDEARNFESASAERARRFAILGNGKSAKLGWAMQDYNPHGAVGNAAAATAEKGRAVLQAAGLSLARLLAELHDQELPHHGSPTGA